MAYPVPSNEEQRIVSLLGLKILDTEHHQDFDDLVAMVQGIFDVPMVALSLIDADRQWFKASRGLDIRQTSRDIAFCSHTICSELPLVVPDATQDNRFYDNPLVRDDPRVRSYAGVRVSVEPGLNIGSLCVIDTKPRTFCAHEIRQLRLLGNIAESLLRAHRTEQALATKAEALENQCRLFDRACELAKMGGFERTTGTDKLVWTAGMFALHDMEIGSEIGLDQHLACYPSSDRRRLVDSMNAAKNSNSAFTFEGRMYTAKGNLKWVRLISDVEIKDGKEVRRFGMKQDITEQHNLTEKITRIAEQDDLTGLLNRRGLRARLTERVADESPKSSFSLFVFDLDGFKEINDGFGHAAGDACLRRIARRTNIVVRNRGHLARTGGDEFSVIRDVNATNCSDATFAEALMEAVRKPIIWRTHTFQLSASVGYTHREGNEAVIIDDVVREADLALYDAKKVGGNSCRSYRSDLGLEVTRKTSSLRESRLALQEGRFELHYQPQIRLGDGKVVGFESLLRMHSTDGKLLTPGSFQSALDDMALSKEIGDFVIRLALDQAAAWYRKNIDFGSIAINLSASQFKDARFACDLLKEIDIRGLPHRAIELEVTEGIFLSSNGDGILSACRTLSDAGVRIAFDDFGTGFASLSHLRDFPVNVIKIDRSFTQGLSQGGNATAIVNAMVGLGINLSMDIVAEGVETESQATFLKAIGCNIAQGFLYSKALPADLAVQYLIGTRKLAAKTQIM